MNYSERYVLDSIKAWVWSGFYTPAEVQEMVGEILEEDADEEMLRSSVDSEFSSKRDAEKSWPDVTDFDRLVEVFKVLDREGILCLHNAGYTMSDGHEDASERLASAPEGRYFGYCSYHGQDLERAVHGGGLTLAFDHVRGDVPEKVEVGQRIQQCLDRGGLRSKWDGSPGRRIEITDFDWKKRNERQPNQALQTTSVTRSVFERIKAILRRWRGV